MPYCVNEPCLHLCDAFCRGSLHLYFVLWLGLRKIVNYGNLELLRMKNGLLDNIIMRLSLNGTAYFEQDGTAMLESFNNPK